MNPTSPQRCSGVLLFSVVLFGALSLAAQARADRKTTTWHHHSAEIESLQIDIARGDIDIRSSKDSTIRLVAHHNGPSDRHPVELEIEESPSKVVISANVDQNTRGKRRISLDIIVEVPTHIHVIARTEAGRVLGVGIGNSVEATTVVGDIRIETESYAQATSTNGDLDISIGQILPVLRLTFATINGNIDLRIPETLGIDLRARSTNGNFSTDLFPTPRNRYGLPGANVRGRLGSGETALSFRSVNGDIKVRRRKG